MSDTVTITKVTDTQFVVTTKFCNGWEQAMPCRTEIEARCYAQGMIDGINSVKNMIAIGPKFSGRVEEA